MNGVSAPAARCAIIVMAQSRSPSQLSSRSSLNWNVYTRPVDATNDTARAPGTAKFLTSLSRLGVEMSRAEEPFTAAGKTWPAGTYIVPAAQAYRAHVLDMFEPQDHPHDTEYPGGPPKAPYDITGYTLAVDGGWLAR